jgi:cytochrome P450
MSSDVLPPGPKTLHPLGHLRAIRTDLLGFLSSVVHIYGDVAYFRAGGRGIALLSHPDHIRDVLLTRDTNFVKGLPLNVARRLVGEGLLTSEGDFHARQSRAVQPAFRPQRVRGYGPAMTTAAEQWASRWDDGATLDVHGELTRLTTTIAAKTLFGVDLDDRTAAGIDQALEDALQLFPWVGVPFLDLILKLPLPKVRRFNRAKAHLDATIQGLIKARRRDGSNHDDLLAILLTAQDEGFEGEHMTDVQVRDEALTLFLTSFDTVSLALTWTLYALSQNPDAEERLRSDIASVLGGRTPSVDDLGNLPLARMVLSEAIRMYPPIYAIAREAKQAFPVGDYTIPAGTLLLMSPYILQRDSRFFARPEEFDPWRWSSERDERPPTFAYFPFGGGSRRCLGQGYAWQEGTLLLVTLLQRWRFQLVEGHKVAIRPLINLRPAGGMPMILRRRA